MTYNLHEIMCKAWKLFRKGIGSICRVSAPVRGTAAKGRARQRPAHCRSPAERRE